MAKRDPSADQRFVDMTNASRRVVAQCKMHHFEACAEIAAGCETGPEAARRIIAELRRTLGDSAELVQEKRCATLRKDA